MYLRKQRRKAKRYVPRDVLSGFTVWRTPLRFRGHSVQFSLEADKIDFSDGDDVVDP